MRDKSGGRTELTKHYHAVTINADGGKIIHGHCFRTRQHAHQRARAVMNGATVKAISCSGASCFLHGHTAVCPRNCGAQRRLEGF